MLQMWMNFLYAWFLSAILGQESGMVATPTDCFNTSPNIQSLAACLDTFTVPLGYYNESTYAIAQPIGTQRQDWKTSIDTLLLIDGNCTFASVPLSLQGLYNVAPFKDFCVLYETASRCGTYLKGWGFMVVPASRRDISRSIHISAPHPQFDGNMVGQAASVFQSTGSATLLVPGRIRNALLSPSSCIQSTNVSQGYYKTDPSHNNEEPFFDASVRIFEWENKNSGCPSSSCAFLQFHGKSDTTCPSDHIFLSSGLGNSSSSKAWYTDESDRPVKRLQTNLRRHFPSWTISLPSDSHCLLTATKNVIGRHLNGIDIPHVCSKAATSRMATGSFIHVEQASLSRSALHYGAWSKVILDTFDANKCSEGMALAIDTKICVPRVDKDSSYVRRTVYTMLGIGPHRIH